MSKAEDFIKSFVGHRSSTLQLANKIEDASFRPWEKAMPAGELFIHMANATLMFATAVSEGVIVRPTPPAEKLDFTNMTVVRAELEKKTEAALEVLRNLPDSAMERLVDTTSIFGQQLPGNLVLMIMRDHEIHHKGQLFIYARMTGVEQLPPISAR